MQPGVQLISPRYVRQLAISLCLCILWYNMRKKGRCELKGGCGSNVYYSSQIR